MMRGWHSQRPSLVSLGVAVFAGAHIISAVERPSTTTTYSMKVGRVTGTTR